MTQHLVIPLGTTGLVKADLGLRFYVDGVLDGGSVLALVAVTEVGSAGDYSVTGLPEPVPGVWYTLTWEYPAGVGGALVYPEPQQGVPPNLILPLREAGLLVADLSLALYRNGALRADALTSTEVGPTGEYRVAGWPSNLSGSWVLVWRRSGISFSFGWSSAGTITGYHGEANAFRDRLAANWGTTVIDWGGGFGGRKHEPVAGTAWVRAGITNYSSRQHSLGTSLGVGWRFPGEFWTQVFVPDTADDAAQIAETYADSLAAIFRGQTFSGVVCSEASLVRVGSSNGWYQVNVLVRFRRDERF